VHAVIEAIGAGPVEMFASSGGAVAALVLVAAYPDDVSTLVAADPDSITPIPRCGSCSPWYRARSWW
jgi:pimeloyl-ACP methyl ester carboxylesterase